MDSFYQFWSETANAEKQLLQWLTQTTQLKQNQPVNNKKMDTTEVKTEVEETMDAIDMSSETQTYILQQQQLPYNSALTEPVHNNEADVSTRKRPRRASVTAAIENTGSEDEDEADLGDNYAKVSTVDFFYNLLMIRSIYYIKILHTQFFAAFV